MLIAGDFEGFPLYPKNLGWDFLMNPVVTMKVYLRASQNPVLVINSGKIIIAI